MGQRASESVLELRLGKHRCVGCRAQLLEKRLAALSLFFLFRVSLGLCNQNSCEPRRLPRLSLGSASPARSRCCPSEPVQDCKKNSNASSPLGTRGPDIVVIVGAPCSQRIEWMIGAGDPSAAVHRPAASAAVQTCDLQSSDSCKSKLASRRHNWPHRGGIDALHCFCRLGATS